MLRDEPSIRPNLYRLPRDDVGPMVLVPAFRQSHSVRGAFGWFTAGWVARLAHGLAAYLSRADAKPMQFTIAPALFPAEYDALSGAVARSEFVLARVEAVFREAASPTAGMLARHAVDCLAWMVMNNRLELRVAKMRPGANYHPKIWLFYDELDIVAVRGSANATGRAFERGVEHMDVDCTWDNRSRVASAVEMVDDWAEGRDNEIEDVLALPEALLEVIVRLAPAEMPTVSQYEAAMSASSPSGEAIDTRSDGQRLFRIPAELRWREGRYAHQGEAVQAWEAQGRRGVIAMATGAGKTIASLIAAYRSWQEHNGPFLIVISAPSTPLLLQWRSECERFGLQAVLPTQAGGKPAKNQSIGNVLLRLRSGDAGHVETLIVTNNLLSSPQFQNALADAKTRVSDLRILHIGDEAHSLGSPSFIKSPPDFIDYRIGLSATPERQYDDDGTAQLFRYFGRTAYEFGLGRAIGFCLVPYDYYVHVAHLDADELNEFRELSAKITRHIARSGGAIDFADEGLTALLVRRRAVVETASSKINVLRSVLTRQSGPIRHTLIYTSSKDPAQILAAKRVVADLGLVASQVTEQETGDRNQLTRILSGFGEGDYDVLLAKRVLDEGVDIPQTRRALLLASSSVEREWVQRRGRILRPAPGKSHAALHDIMALPPPKESELYEDSVLQFISSELDRLRAFGRHARNRTDVLNVVGDVHRQYFME